MTGKTLPLILAAVLPATLHAQTVVEAETSNGPFVGIPALFSVSAGTAGLASKDSATEGYFKKVGFESVPPVPLDPSSSPAVPDFSAKAMFRDPCSIPASKALPDIDAVSLGLDWITVRSGGIVRVPPGHWSGILFSTTKSSRGKFGQIAGETRRTDSYAKVGADLLSYFYRGSVLPPNLVDVTQRSNDATELRVRADAEVDGVDIYAPLYRLAMNAGLRLPDKVSYYFSVSSGSKGLVPASWWKRGSKTLPVSGATVFVTTWDGMSKKWSCPTAAFAPADLGLADGEDVDAFSYDVIQGRVLLSTKTKGRDPILFVDLRADLAAAVPVVYSDTNNTPISDRTGLDIGLADDVDAICSADPGPTQGVQLGRVLGQPLFAAFGPGPQLVQVQCWRDVNPNNVNQHIERLYVVGARQPGIALLFLQAPFGAWFSPLPPLQVPRRPQFHGNPFHVQIHFPANLQTQFNSFWLTVPPNQLFPFKVGIPHAVRL